MKIGLTLGKYAPLHKGHQLVIETALRETDHLYVMIYDSPHITEIPLPVRADWIRRLYPQTTVIEAYNGPREVGYTPEIMREQEEFILKHVHDKNITHFYSSEPYGDHVSKRLNAINCCIDIPRQTVPISASKIRQNPLAARLFLDDLVYRDHIINAVFLGAPSTGKTTLCEFLSRQHDTVWMPEYGREYWDKHQSDRRLTLQQLVEIATGHLEREEAMLQKANRFLFTDTNVLTTLIFSNYYHQKPNPELEALADKHQNRYDLYFLCDTDIPYDDTWDRSGAANRDEMQAAIIADLQQRHISFTLLQGNLEQRAAKASTIITQHKKTNFPPTAENPPCL